MLNIFSQCTSDSRIMSRAVLLSGNPHLAWLKPGDRESWMVEIASVRRIYQSGCGSNYAKTRAIIVTHKAGNRAPCQFPKIGRRAVILPQMQSIDIQIIYLTDPSPRRTRKGDGGNSARGWPPYVTRREGRVRGGPADPRGDHLLPPGGSQLTPETTVFR